MSEPIALVWHRRDLRLDDNPALNQASTAQAQVLGVYIFDPEILKRPDTAPIRVHFLRESLVELQAAYRACGGRLIICRGEPVAELVRLSRELEVRALYFNDDIEPSARERDGRVTQALTAAGVEVHACADVLLHDPTQVLTQQGKTYTVYTPFWRNWSARLKPDPFDAPTHLKSPEIETGTVPDLRDLGFNLDQTPVVSPGEKAARQLVEQFCKQAIYAYAEQRDLPAEPATSLLGPHLRFGTLGIRSVWRRTHESFKAAQTDQQRRGVLIWQQELGWREFYKYVLYHFPHVAARAFRPEFDQFPFDADHERFERWCQGETGYPIVDAGMRQLNATGFMHNRLRMIVASFLVKDLLLPYQSGELYFMQKLACGDLSANNGGWQWAASMGTDPKPLRIFNPSTQSGRYDTRAKFIRRWVPELAGVATDLLINSEKFPPLLRAQAGYPTAIVDHREQQQVFKQRYRDTKRADGPTQNL